MLKTPEGIGDRRGEGEVSPPNTEKIKKTPLTLQNHKRFFTNTNFKISQKTKRHISLFRQTISLNHQINSNGEVLLPVNLRYQKSTYRKLLKYQKTAIWQFDHQKTAKMMVHQNNHPPGI